MMDTPPICNYEGSDYQQSFWEQGGRAYEDAVEAVALNRLLPAGGKLLLELGAGAGRNTPRYRHFERIVLLDYSRTQLLQARERLGGGGRYIYVAADIYHLPFATGVFDAATMIRTLHHMAEPQRALSQVRWVLQKDAVFILEYANKQNLKAILRFALGRQKWNPFSLEPVEFTALNYDFHPKAVRGWLRSSGFSIERQLTVSHFRAGLFKKVLPLRLLVAMDSLAQWSGNWWQLSPSVFTRCRAQGVASPADAGASPAQAGVSPAHAGASPAAIKTLFACPACGTAPLEESSEKVACLSCGRTYPLADGIYDFRLNAA